MAINDSRAERAIGLGVQSILQTYLSDEFDRLGIGDYGAPDVVHGYSEDFAQAARDASHYIAWWTDFVDPLEKSMGPRSKFILFEHISIGMMYMFSVPLPELGKHKSLAGEAIRNMLYRYGHTDAKPQGAALRQIWIETDYRFSTQLSSGGRARAPFGERTLTGNIKDSIGIRFHAEVRRQLDINL